MNGIWGVELSLRGSIQHYWIPGRGMGIQSLCGIGVQGWHLHQSSVPTCRDCVAKKYNIVTSAGQETINGRIDHVAGRVTLLEDDAKDVKHEIHTRFTEYARYMDNLAARVSSIEEHLRLINAGLTDLQKKPNRDLRTLSDYE